MKTLILLLIAGGLLNARAVSLPDGPEVGQLAPALALSIWLQAPSDQAQIHDIAQHIVIHQVCAAVLDVYVEGRIGARKRV
jgi:hypothetical protein